ncbi:thiamine pyrophosphate-binding protein [Castellaniella sp.]|uniref:thiamine pyrophosphate-binding protein n=1 Tax=Castellaniella sp. TaxID=1955812 RepID=UPI002B002A4E|nr:thiamine pyrophosphate-binding protein [Castellaniella sp.]
MTVATTPRLAGHILVDQLRLHGTDHVFCVPGESYLAVLDGLVDADIQVTVCRQEGGAAMMAEAYGKLTGRPGICLVTRAPGATNAIPGIHIASQDSTPMILLVGQIQRSHRDREAFQEMDYSAVFGSQVKWAAEIDQAERIPEYLARAFHVAQSGRPGPVVLALPEDMLTETLAVADARPCQRTDSYPDPAQQQKFADLLAQAKRPLAILGGSGWDAESVQLFGDFARRHDIPVAVQFRRQMLCPTDHPNFIGDLGLGSSPQLLAAIRESDLILAVGGRLSEVPSQGYTLLGIPDPGQALVHVHPDINELNRVYQADAALACSPRSWVQTIQQMAATNTAERKQRCDSLHAQRQAWSDPSQISIPGPLQLGAVVSHLNATLPVDTIMTNGAGNFATWIHRFYQFRAYGTQLAPTSGSMGYGLPAAVAAKRIFPTRTVVCFTGDGSFMMHGQEFSTAVQYGLPIVVIIIDNHMYGTIRMHQERHYPGRVSATNLHNPDFAAYARAFGGHGERVENTAEFAPALQRAMASGLPSIVHCILDPEAITPTTSLSRLREDAQRSD